jgi:hypothetical protein
MNLIISEKVLKHPSVLSEWCFVFEGDTQRNTFVATAKSNARRGGNRPLLLLLQKQGILINPSPSSAIISISH